MKNKQLIVGVLVAIVTGFIAGRLSVTLSNRFGHYEIREVSVSVNVNGERISFVKMDTATGKSWGLSRSGNGWIPIPN